MGASALTLALALALALTLSRWAHMSTQDAEAMRVAAEIRGGLEAWEIWGDMGEIWRRYRGDPWRPRGVD